MTVWHGVTAVVCRRLARLVLAPRRSAEKIRSRQQGLTGSLNRILAYKFQGPPNHARDRQNQPRPPRRPETLAIFLPPPPPLRPRSRPTPATQALPWLSQEIKPPAAASDVLRDHPGFQLLEADEVKLLGARARPLSADAPLHRGHLYFLVALPRRPASRAGPPRRAWSGNLQVGARERLESLKLSCRSTSDLSSFQGHAAASAPTSPLNAISEQLLYCMGRPPCCEQAGVKKGPWTPEEDLVLVSYIQDHGPGNWRAVPTTTGLMRCSKSCRLRWTNYLRPGIKRGNFTDQEEKLIVHLQALLGNR
ncbi:uncharacterized protein [Lolium perenne]|uniref:uncharacterized protein n=1 Tax=Lolium perenne TaxID=4522 RepID=UPI003A98E32B